MKTFNKTFLPDKIVYNNETYKVNAAISGAMHANSTQPKVIANTLKSQGRKCILVNVLSSQWIYTND